MLAQLRSSLTYANVMATVALFVALGGTSYAVATGSIDSREIKNDTVRSKDVRNNDIRSRDVRNRSLLAKDFKANELPAGPSGATGATGATGAPGTARAYARVSTFVGQCTLGPGSRRVPAVQGERNHEGHPGRYRALLRHRSRHRRRRGPGGRLRRCHDACPEGQRKRDARVGHGSHLPESGHGLSGNYRAPAGDHRQSGWGHEQRVGRRELGREGEHPIRDRHPVARARRLCD